MGNLITTELHKSKKALLIGNDEVMDDLKKLKTVLTKHFNYPEVSIGTELGHFFTRLEVQDELFLYMIEPKVDIMTYCNKLPSGTRLTVIMETERKVGLPFKYSNCNRESGNGDCKADVVVISTAAMDGIMTKMIVSSIESYNLEELTWIDFVDVIQQQLKDWGYSQSVELSVSNEKLFGQNIGM